MSCYSPLVGYCTGINAETGKKNIAISKPNRIVEKFIVDNEGKEKYIKFAIEDLIKTDPNYMLIPCGKCIGCRMDYSRHWADRMMLERESAGKAVFVTLTYDCRNVVNKNGKRIKECEFPEISETKNCPLHEVCSLDCRLHGSLYKQHVQTFLKDLREELRSKYGVFIRFWCTGEYGDIQKSHRPHYHLILFGIGLDDLQGKIPVGFNELRQEVYTHPLIADHWPYGFVSIGDVSWRSCAYVARYVNKKVLEPGSDLLIESLGKNPIYSTMSRRPGIGKPYLDKHPDCLDYVSIYLSTSDGSKKISIPKYFVNQLELTDPERFDSITKERALYAQNTLLSKLSATDKDLLSYLETEEKEKLKSIRSLKRYI